MHLNGWHVSLLSASAKMNLAKAVLKPCSNIGRVIKSDFIVFTHFKHFFFAGKVGKGRDGGGL